MQCLQWHEGRRAAEAEPGLGFNPAELLEVSQASRGFGAVAQAVIVFVCAAFSSGPGRGMQKKENADSIKRRALSLLVELHGSGLTVEHLEHLDIERPSVAYSLVR